MSRIKTGTKPYSETLKIGVLARRTGLSVPTLRYYEEVGLMPSPDRRDRGHRVYFEDDVPRLMFIRRCRDLGFPIAKINGLVRAMQVHDPSCVEYRDSAQERLIEVRAKLDEMKALEETLTGFLQNWESAWAGGPLGCVVPDERGQTASAVSESTILTPGADVPSAIFRDPPSDPVLPATFLAVQIKSQGQNMNAAVYVPDGRGPHPVAVLMHGFPGNESNIDLAQVLRRAGWTVVTFHYRGTWGSEGKFSFEGMRQDTRAVLAACRSQKAAKSWRADTKRIVVIGHGLGGFAAADVCASEANLMGCIILAPRDPGHDARLATSMTSSQRDRYAADEFAGVDQRTNGPSARQLVDVLVAEGGKWRMAKFASALATRPILIVLTKRDRDERAPELIPALHEVRATRLKIVHLEADADFNNLRIGLETLLLEWLAELQGAPRDSDRRFG